MKVKSTYNIKFHYIEEIRPENNESMNQVFSNNELMEAKKEQMKQCAIEMLELDGDGIVTENLSIDIEKIEE